MKIYISDILKISWISEIIPDSLKKLKASDYFIFYYDNIEETSSINIKHHHTADSVDDRVFRIQYQYKCQNFGFIKEPFDSDSIMFYMFLKYYVQKQENNTELLDKLDNLFLEYKSKDLAILRSSPVSSKVGEYDINSLSQLENAVNYFVTLPKYRGGVVKCFEMANNYFKNKYGHQLYGKKLKKIIQLINNPSGGIITYYGGSVRYMIVGERSLKAVSDGSLDKAKLMLRQEVDQSIIRLETGWYLNPFDGKWRKRISDKDINIDFSKMVSHPVRGLGDVLLYAPTSDDIKVDDIFNATSGRKSNIDLIKNGYKGTVGDVIIHPLLFEYYPEIKTIPIFIGFHNGNKDLYEYYFSDKPKHLNIFGQLNSQQKYVILHEMQHYIQGKEGFGNGGNLSVSQLIVAMGGDDVRKFMSMLHQSIDKFCTDVSRMDLNRIVNYFSKENNPDANRMMIYFDSVDSIQKNCESAFQMFSQYYAMNWESNPAFRKLTNEVFGEYYKPFFELMSESGSKKQIKNEYLLKKGWTQAEIHTLFFNTYQSLSGEFESREVQNTAEIKEELLDYFKFYSSESLRAKDVNVVFKEGIIEDVYDHLGALEMNNEGDYLIHVKKYLNGVNMVHELGHILEDEAIMQPCFESIANAFNKVGKTKFETISEFFIDCYFGWLVRKNIDKELCSKLNEELVFKSLVETDKVFNYMFGYESERSDLIGLEKCFQYVDKLSKIL
jgi:hypothetical protein